MKEKFSNKSLALMEARTLKKRTSKVNYDFYEEKNRERERVFCTKKTKKIDIPPIRSIMKQIAN